MSIENKDADYAQWYPWYMNIYFDKFINIISYNYVFIIQLKHATFLSDQKNELFHTKACW